MRNRCEENRRARASSISRRMGTAHRDERSAHYDTQQSVQSATAGRAGSPRWSLRCAASDARMLHGLSAHRIRPNAARPSVRHASRPPLQPRPRAELRRSSRRDRASTRQQPSAQPAKRITKAQMEPRRHQQSSACFDSCADGRRSMRPRGLSLGRQRMSCSVGSAARGQGGIHTAELRCIIRASAFDDSTQRPL